jgi:hypothetical protein
MIHNSNQGQTGKYKLNPALLFFEAYLVRLWVEDIIGVLPTSLVLRYRSQSDFGFLACFDLVANLLFKMVNMGKILLLPIKILDFVPYGF